MLTTIDRATPRTVAPTPFVRGAHGRRIPDIANLPPSPQSPDEWFDWADLILLHRAQVILETAGDERNPDVKAARDREARRCRESRQYMLATYGSIFEARPPEEEAGVDDGSEDAPGAMIPFIPYPFQIYVIDQYYEARRTKGLLGDVLFPKARDMGLSNIIGFVVAGDFLCERVFSARIASRTEDLVDEVGNPDSLMWKIEMFMKGLPKWLMDRLAPGFDWAKHRKVLQFRRPDNANTIIGESTQANTGRGGRATVIVYDEAAFMDNFDAIWMAGRSSTRHRIAISTVNTSNGLGFMNLHKGKGGYTRPRVVEVHWDEHPLHDDAWLAEERKRDTPDGIAREVMMDYDAGNTEWIYPETHDLVPGHFPFEPGAGHTYVTMDDGFDDDFAMVRIQYIRATGRLRVFAGFQDRHKKTDYYGSLLKGVPEAEFNYADDARRFMEQSRELPPGTYTIDVHFDNVEQMTGTSPYERFIEKYGITCHMEMNRNNRVHLNRWRKLKELLPMMDFHQYDGAPNVLEALQRYRQKPQKEGSEADTEKKAPMHTRDSHFVTALEWYALAWDSIKYNADAIGSQMTLPAAHNTPTGTAHGHAPTANPSGIAQSHDDACPRGYSRCAYRDARTGGCAACGLGRTFGGPNSS